MIRRQFLAVVAAGLLAVSLQAQAADLPEVKVFAAASATDALNEIGAMYAAQGKGKLVPSYASSSTLAKQIENGAPAEIFISADEQWADYLSDRKLLTGRVALLGNRLALIAPASSKVELGILPHFPLAQVLKDGRLAVGDPDHVPVGIYTKAALTKLGVWTEVEPKLARADSVRAAMAYVDRGECPLGIVYSTDAWVDPKVRIVATFPEDSHPPIVYPAALVAGKETTAAKDFFAFIQSDAAKDVWRKYGFLVK
ncbi:MAG TPA: molybdate ABC transporter substrate-binding protein [Candidatus Sulfotelmatobacter sp.]|jgi:molybdate transport system substrate-binding protein|nr:molybdate ABC transporter substrate-binding protein [Candidatus Sulfotelmatobacter sp.]